MGWRTCLDGGNILDGMNDLAVTEESVVLCRVVAKSRLTRKLKKSATSPEKILSFQDEPRIGVSDRVFVALGNCENIKFPSNLSYADALTTVKLVSTPLRSSALRHDLQARYQQKLLSAKPRDMKQMKKIEGVTQRMQHTLECLMALMASTTEPAIARSCLCKFNSDMVLFECHSVKQTSLCRFAEDQHDEIYEKIGLSEAAHLSGEACSVCALITAGQIGGRRASDSYECMKGYIESKLPNSFIFPSAQMSIQTVSPPANIGERSDSLVLWVDDKAHIPFHVPGWTEVRQLTNEEMKKSFGVTKSP